jgi:hypothetical protein
MDILLLISITITVLAVLSFFNDIFPCCKLCGKIKIRPLFLIHRSRGFLPFYSKSESACKKCCSKYSIETFKRLEQICRIKRKNEFSSMR